MKFLFVDRIENKRIVCEDKDGEEVILDMQSVQCKVKEGDVIYINSAGNVVVDERLTRSRKQEILKMRSKLTKFSE